MADEECTRKGIPSYLHTEARPVVPYFTTGEHLFRRFSPAIEMEESYPLAALKTGSLPGMSFNREQFSRQPEDVLYDCHTGEFRQADGIVAFEAGHLAKIHVAHPSISGQAYTIRPIHKPERCMYPHSEFEILCNGSAASKISSATVKTDLRDRLAEGSKVIRKPASISRPPIN